tara:strand:- start:407 stop:892 length:486 start_codon:yes stop_codon:yes gene_type:complete
MKKLSLYAFLFLILLAGCSNKKETLLENCADQTYLPMYNSKIYLIEKVSNKAGEYTTLKSEVRNTRNKMRKNYTNWLKYKKQKTKEKAELNRLNNIWHASSEVYKKAQSAVDEFEIKTSRETFQSLNFDDKIKINVYYSLYRMCEKEFQNTPTAFTKRWKK